MTPANVCVYMGQGQVTGEVGGARVHLCVGNTAEMGDLLIDRALKSTLKLQYYFWFESWLVL